VEHDAQRLIERGDSLLAAGEDGAALAAYDAAADLSPGDVAALVRAGTVLLDVGDVRPARRYLERAAANTPDDAGIQWLLGMVALASGDGQTARESLERARARGADGAEIMLDLALAAYLALDREAATGYASGVLVARPDHSEARMWLEKLHALDEQALLIDVARAHCREGRFEVAIALLTSALESAESYDARLYLGRAYLALGDAEHALPHLEAALALRPGEEAALVSATAAHALAAAYPAGEPAAAAPGEPHVGTRVLFGPPRYAPVVPICCERCGASVPEWALACPECGTRRLDGGV